MSTLPSIEITTDEQRVNDAAITALGTDESIYQRGGQLVHITLEPARPDAIARPERTPRIAPVPTPILRERMAAAAKWLKRIENPNGGVRDVESHPPTWSVSAVHARGRWDGIRVLEAVVGHPVLRRDGTVLSSSGYDSGTGLYLACDVEVSVPANPSIEDVRAAVALILEMLIDFPFSKAAHRAAWVASLLTPLARFSFAGPAPMFLVDANVRGSGKSLLCDLGAIILTGRDMPRMSNPRDDDEARKRITALALAGDSLILLDNIASMLGSASLDAALTGTVWSDRILGRSEIIEMPLYATWWATGNNVAIAADTSRRVAWIRLDSPMEKPEEREGFAHEDIRQWARENRGRLLSAGLTILRGFCAAGRPTQRLIPWGSFEDWSNLVRSAVVWAGLDDPGATRQELAERSDTEAAALRAILTGLEALDTDGRGLTVREIIERITKSHKDTEAASVLVEALGQICNSTTEIPSAKSIGRRLRHLQGRIVGGRALRSRNHKNTCVWYVASSSSTDSGSKGGFDGFGGFVLAIPRAREDEPLFVRGEDKATKPTKATTNQTLVRWANGRTEPLANGHLPIGVREWSTDGETWRPVEEFRAEVEP